MRMRTPRYGAAAVVALSLLAAACGSSDDAGDGVASLGSTTTVAGSADAADDSTDAAPDPQEAMLAYAQCMRDEGIDMPDPQIAPDDGGFSVSSGTDDGEAPAFDIDSDEFRTADTTCHPILAEAVGEVEIDPEQQAEMREQLLEYAQCMRDEGIDFPDPEFGANGTVTMEVGSPGGEAMSDADQAAMSEAAENCAAETGSMSIVAAGPEAG